jgi:siroheme synthase-like protein
VNLQGARVVVTGGGGRAFAVAGRLAAAGARVRLACPDEAAARAACAGCECEYVQGAPGAEHLDGALLLVAASEDADADADILSAAQERGVLAASLNGVGGRAVLGTGRSQGRVALGATTSGLCEELEGKLADEAGQALVPALDAYAEILGGVRDKLAERYPDAERRERIWRQIFDSPVLALLQAGDEDEAVELAERMAWGTG